jgi:PIN domain nuclease of toxin-antitoxin system
MTTMALRTFISFYLLLRSERLSVSTKLTLYKALIRSILTYVCSAWEFAADSNILKLQRLQKEVLRTIDNLPRRTPTCDLHVAFQIP